MNSTETTKTTRSGLLWPVGQRLEARRALAMEAGLGGTARHDPDHAAGDDAERTFDVEDYDVWADAPAGALRAACPVLIELSGAGWLAILRCRGRNAVVCAPSGVARLPLAELEAALWSGASSDPRTARLADAAEGWVGALRDGGATGGADVARLTRALLTPALFGQPLASGERLRATVGGMRRELLRPRILWRALLLPIGYALQFALFLRVWSVAGTLVLARIPGVGAGPRPPETSSPRALPWVELGAYLAAWVLAQLSTSAFTSRLALEVGGVIRAWLIRRMLRLDPERLRSAGIGDLLGRVLEAESLDALALGGGVQTLAGAFEMGTGIGVMVIAGATRMPIVSAVVGLFVLAGMGWVQARQFSHWARRHRGLSHDLVERMSGHATVLIQECVERRIVADERDVQRYATAARRMDGAEIALTVVVPQSWLLATLLVGLIPLVARANRVELGTAVAAAGSAPSPSAAAVATMLGGIWLFYSGLRRGSEAIPMLVAVRHAWARMAPLILGEGFTERAEDAAAASSPAVPTPSPETAATLGPEAPSSPPFWAPAVHSPRGCGELVARNLSFRFPGRSRSVLENLDLRICAGERILIQGASGAGKSTLAALLTGLKTPTKGELSLNGQSQKAMGLSLWRQRVGAVPQFHDNHVLCGELLFNLLMGRRWPPRLADIAAAEAVCRRLGLGPLLGRMPAGLQQQVGETGWQLSHGEQSRIFLARSLLQSLEVRVLDETFAALDPETLDEVMQAVLAEPATLLVVAHP